MAKENKNEIQIRIINFIDEIKAKTIVSVTDLEKYLDMLFNVDRSIESLKESREIWKKKYFELKRTKSEDPRTITKVEGFEHDK